MQNHLEEKCPLPGLAEDICGSLTVVSKEYGIPLQKLVSDIIGSVALSWHISAMRGERIGYDEMLSLLTGAPWLMNVFEYALFHGFRRLLKLMVLEDVDCYVPREGMGCSEATGALMVFAGSAEEAPTSLTLGIGYPTDNPLLVEVNATASITAATSDMSGESPELARRAATRTITYARKTRYYRELEDYIADTSYWSLRLEPGDEVDDGIPEVIVELEAAGPPGAMLPFNLNPLLDLTSYINDRLNKEYNKLTKTKK